MCVASGQRQWHVGTVAAERLITVVAFWVGVLLQVVQLLDEGVAVHLETVTFKFGQSQVSSASFCCCFVNAKRHLLFTDVS